MSLRLAEVGSLREVSSSLREVSKEGHLVDSLTDKFIVRHS